MPIVLELDGSAGNTATCPDSVPLSFAGDIDVRVKFSMSDYTPAASMTLASKFGGAGQRTWSLELRTDGGLNWTWSSDGTATTVDTSTTQIMTDGGFAPNEPRWVRITHDVDDGASGNRINFYTSEDGTTWSQLGDEIVNSGTTSFHNSNATVNVGMRASAGFPSAGLFYELVVMEGIAGTIRANPDFTDAAQGWVAGDDAGDTGSDGTNTWTLAAAATIIDQPTNIQQAQVLLQAAIGNNPFSSSVSWIDLTDDMRAVSFSRGRQYELDRINAGTMSVTLANNDGQYNAHNTAGVYYPDIKPMVPIRLRAVYDGTVYPLWQGFVERWPVSFPAQVDSVVDVQCVDLFKALSLAVSSPGNRTSAVEALNPVAWWRFADDTDEAGGDNTLTFSGSPTEGGAAGGWDDDVATTFDGTDDFATVANDADVTREAEAVSWEVWCRPTGTSGSDDYVFSIGGFALLWDPISVRFEAAGGLLADATVSAWHHVVVTHNGSTTKSLYVDGVFAGSSNSPGGNPLDSATVYIGQSSGGTLRFAGDISEIAVYPTVLTDQEVAGLFAASFEAYATERTDERIATILATASLGIGAEYVFTDLEEGQTTMSGANSPTGTSALEAIQTAADTELGQFFMTADGYARFHDRHYRLMNQETPIDTFGPSDLAYLDVRLTLDDERIYNDIRVSPSDDADPFIAQDATSIESYGRRTLSLTTYPNDQNEGYDFAHALKQIHSEPTTRIEAVDVRLGGDSDLWPAILAAELGNRYTVDVPLAGDDLNQDVYLEAIAHTITRSKTWDVTFQLSPAADDTFWLLGVTGSSELDETTTLGF